MQFNVICRGRSLQYIYHDHPPNSKKHQGITSWFLTLRLPKDLATMRSFTFALTVLPLLSAAYLVEPDTPAAPDTVEDCTYWQVATETDTCESIAKDWAITLEQFNTYVRHLAEVSPCSSLVLMNQIEP